MIKIQVFNCFIIDHYIQKFIIFLCFRFGFVDFADYGVVRKIMNITKHYIKGKRIRIDMTRPRIGR